MKKFLFLFVLSPLAFAVNPMRDMAEYGFQTIVETDSFKLEEIKLHNEIYDYAMTLHSKNKKAEFEWTCAIYPFLYVPELSQLGSTDSYDLNIELDNGSVIIKHYTVHPNGAMISRNYITNHFPVLLEAIVNGKNMRITLVNAQSKPQYNFASKDVLDALQTFMQKCRAIDY